jgi:hypothetical protein
VTVDEQVPMGKEFVSYLRDGGVPRIDGIAGAAFLIYYGQVNEDSDGPIEWCRPVPDDQAAEQHRQPADLGARITFLARLPITADSRPDCDFAVPLR